MEVADLGSEVVSNHRHWLRVLK